MSAGRVATHTELTRDPRGCPMPGTQAGPRRIVRSTVRVDSLMNGDTDGGPRPGGRQWAGRLAAALVPAALAGTILLAACGGSPSAAPAASRGLPTVQMLDSFATYMRSRGVPNFYFSRSTTSAADTPNDVLKLGPWVAPANPSSPQFQAAMRPATTCCRCATRAQPSNSRCCAAWSRRPRACARTATRITPTPAHRGKALSSRRCPPTSTPARHSSCPRSKRAVAADHRPGQVLPAGNGVQGKERS